MEIVIIPLFGMYSPDYPKYLPTLCHLSNRPTIFMINLPIGHLTLQIRGNMRLVLHCFLLIFFPYHSTPSKWHLRQAKGGGARLSGLN